MTSAHGIKIETLTPEAFAPFGRVFQPHEIPDFDLPTKSVHRFPWQCDASLILQLISFKPQPFKVHKIERHFHVTESRMHIGGSPTVIVVSEPAEEVPTPAKLRAFRLDRQGVMFKLGTWHAVDAYPLGNEPGLFLFLSDKETQSELFDNPVADPKRSIIRTYDGNPPEILVD